MLAAQLQYRNEICNVTNYQRTSMMVWYQMSVCHANNIGKFIHFHVVICSMASNLPTLTTVAIYGDKKNADVSAACHLLVLVLCINIL